jgi:hypothetical protein
MEGILNKENGDRTVKGSYQLNTDIVDSYID